MKKIALYDPYLDVFGGGERHILSIIQSLEKDDYEMTIFWDKNVTEDLKNKLDITFRKKPSYRKNIFVSGTSALSVWQTLREFDLFFYVTDGSYFLSGAKKTFIFCMYPKKELYNMSALNRLKTVGNRFITNSFFTKKNLANWGINAEVLYPFISNDLLNAPLKTNREPIILSVGRFFSHLHAKKQDKLIDAFSDFKKTHKSPLKLILAGGMKEEDEAYVSDLKKKIAQNADIKLLTNIPYDDLRKLYDHASYYWHFAGFGVDEVRKPYAVEHLGITPLEAMSRGVVVFAYKAGGPKELIKNGETGFLFSDTKELFAQIQSVEENDVLKKTIQKNAQTFVFNNFRQEVFDKRVKEVIV